VPAAVTRLIQADSASPLSRTGLSRRRPGYHAPRRWVGRVVATRRRPGRGRSGLRRAGCWL